MTDVENIKVIYYYVSGSELKTLILFLMSAVIVGFIFKDGFKSDFSKIFSKGYRNTMIFSVGYLILSVVVTVILAFISTWFGAHGMSCTDEVKASSSYIPDVEQLCTVEGEKIFSSYDEYRAYYYDLAEKRIAENYDVRRDYKKVENVVPLYVYGGALFLYIIFRRKRKNE